MSRKLALVLGTTGGIGGAVARRLMERGWQVRALTRRPQPPPSPGSVHGGLDWMPGDAMAAVDVARAADGATLIVHAVNPPGYRHWDRLVLPMLESTIAAARATGARVILPGNVYNHGPLPLIDEDSPQAPNTAKGRIRVEMERRLQDAAEAGAIKVLLVRAGDFFGPGAANNWFSQALVKPGAVPRAITYPGRPGVGHQWAYLPDVAETMLRLAERDDLGAFATYNMEGHWDGDGRQMVEALRRVLGRPDLPVKPFPWTATRLLSPVVPLFREIVGMKYLWDQPVRMTNARLVALLGEEPHTPLDTAVRETLTGLGCLPAREAAVI